MVLPVNNAQCEFDWMVGEEKALDVAQAHAWQMISMQEDFVRVFPFE